MPTNIILIDSRVTGYQTLIDSLATPSEVFIIDAESDGLAQIAARLQGRSDIDALHLISHGSQGALYLGTTVLDSSNLASYATPLASIGSALTPTGDILLYGCNVAQGDSGLQFISALAQATGADVAASSNATGASILGGDAVLEQASGSVEAASLALNGLDGLLTVNTAPTFAAGDGVVTTDFGTDSDVANSVTLQADGKILLAGYSGGDFALVRYNSNGSLDTSFSGDGKLTTAIGTSSDGAKSMTLQADGKILLAGISNNSEYEDFALVRYNADGSLDSSFSGDGKLTTAIGTYSDIANSVTLQADGKILLAGYSYNYYSGVGYSALVRYNSDGSLDSSFSGDGILTAAHAVANSVVLQADGKILLAGSSGGDFALARYNSDGSLDSSFSGDGMLTTAIGTNNAYDYGQSVALQADGKILLAGDSNGDFALVRYNSNGSLDTSFSGDGKLTTAIGTYSDIANSMTLQADGKILLAGSSGGNFALARYNSDGSLDSSFSGDGMLITDLGTGYHYGNSMTLQADGKILLAGSGTNSSGNYDFALVRYNSDGSLDGGFDTRFVNTLDARITYTGNAPVVLDTNVRIYDAALSLSNNFYGATVTLVRHGGADASDVFSAKAAGTLSALTSGGYFSISGVAVGRVLANANGTLKLGFTAGSTRDQVNQTLQQIAYANTASIPAARAQIDWTFSDGNTGSQGTGGALSVTGSTVVTITAGNVAPKLAHALADFNIAPDQPFSHKLPTNTFSDANTGEPFVFSIATADGSAVPPWLLFDRVTGTFSGTPGIFDVGTVAIQVTATDSAGASVSDVLNLTVSSNNFATGSVTLRGTATQGQTLTAANTLTDLDGLGTIKYQWLANGTAISGATASTLVLGAAQVGKTISVKASYTDGQGNPESVTSAATAAVAVFVAPGVTFRNATALSTTEDGGTAAFQVVLKAAPRHDVVLTLSINDATEGKFQASGNASSAVTFTATNWNVAQTVTLLGVDDGKLLDGNIAYNVLTAVSSDDLRYNGMRSGTGLPIANLTVTNTDNDAADAVFGDTSGRADDLLRGGNGASDLYGYAGRDEMYGGNGDDRLYGGYEDDVLYGDADNDELEGEQGNDNLNGGTGNDLLNGGTGKDTLLGGDGNDTLDGSSDADSMNGGNGADTYYVDNTSDIVSDTGTDTGKDTVYITAFLATGYTLGKGIDNAALQAQANNAALTGNTGNNTLTGNASNNALDGGAGADNLNGGDGLDNLTGGDGADSLNGGLGNDILYAGSGNDVVDAGEGNDMIVGGDGAGNDRYTGGAGTDTVKYTSATATITVNLSTGTATGTNIGSDTLAQIENVIGGKGSDSLTGNTLANSLTGDTGNDTLSAGAGNDVLIGGLGADRLTGGTGADRFDFNALTELGLTSTTRDTIADFKTSETDKIDLQGVDANTAQAGDQAFSFLGTAVFTGNATGKLRFDATAHILYGSTDADTAAEFAIVLTGVNSLAATGLVL